MRVFVAAEITEELLFALAHTQAELRATIHGRFVPTDSLHITLAFLGELSTDDYRTVAKALSCATAHFGPVSVCLGDFGSFGPAHKAVLWQAVEGAGILALAKVIRDALRSFDVAFDDKSFRPHVTLMRAANISRATLPTPIIAQANLDTVCIYRSHLHSTGASYELIDRFELNPYASNAASNTLEEGYHEHYNHFG